jgi:hypothetical protein
MDLDFGGKVKAHQVQHLGMIVQFFCTSLEYSRIYRIDEGELIRVHRDSHPMGFNQLSDLSKLSFKKLLPVESAYRMRCQRNQVRGDSEK